MTSSDIDLERERIDCVFGFGGGELHLPNNRYPDDWDGPEGSPSSTMAPPTMRPTCVA